ncbi:MAG: glycoside hydrolase family 3 protein, partial [Clostridia bacterium]|nr:glycoside hydrolase family 3 protein [Clostridia bacterium]
MRDIKELDIKTKAGLLTGRGFWATAECAEIGLPSVKLSDGPHGMRVQVKRPNHLGMGSSLPATCFPTASATACTFNVGLCETLGKYIGVEAASFGVGMVLGPGLNIKRSPLCGRNFEYFSEDSYLSGKIAAAYVRGIQSTGVTACIKHFAVNGREYARMYCDSRVDEQTLRETYLTGFEIAVKEGGAGAVMSAYNKVNGVYCNQNEFLLKTVLRGEWGFDGLVVSDWGGSRGRAEAVKAGAALEMPYCGMSAAEIVNAVGSGDLDESAVDECVERICKFADKARRISVQPFDKAEHDEFARIVAEESAVLLKNDGGALPLKEGERVALIGDFAKYPRYQGAGSSQIVPTSLGNMLGAIKNSKLDFIGFAEGFERFGGENKRLLKRALKLAANADTVI